MKLTPEPVGQFAQVPNTPAALPGGQWLAADQPGAGFVYRIEPGALAEVQWLAVDLLALGVTNLAFGIELLEDGQERGFRCGFNVLPRAQARFRLNLEALNLNRWRYRREGACLKPLTAGVPVNPARVTAIKFTLWQKAAERAVWCMTPLAASAEEPPLLEHPALPSGALLDELGQFALKNWRGKTADADELVARLRGQLASPGAPIPNRSRWGGWSERRVEATGFFRTHHDGQRWWLVDPEGCLFWSAGPDCTRPVVESNIKQLRDALAWLPARDGAFADAFIGSGEIPSDEAETFDYLIANLIRAFGAGWRGDWQRLVYPLLRHLGCNTAGNWSDTDAASRAAMPYVLPLSQPQWSVPRIFRDFPDVFDPAFDADAERFAAPLKPLASDPAMLGYFLMNEPEWGFTELLPAEGMLRNTADCATRRALLADLRGRYAGDDALRAAWGVPFAELERGLFTQALTPAARADLERFSTVMARKLYSTLSAACRRAAPHHLNLGARFASVPDGQWLLDAMDSFDVFSINCYRKEGDDRLAPICERLGLPALIGEWHFGALDAGLPAPGLGHNPDQRERGNAYRFYMERTAAKPWCVGAHWFTLYDQSAVGRGDGENYNIGFLDVCHRPYEELTAAARETHARLYQVADGQLPPYSEPPRYAERLNM